MAPGTGWMEMKFWTTVWNLHSPVFGLRYQMVRMSSQITYNQVFETNRFIWHSIWMPENLIFSSLLWLNTHRLRWVNNTWFIEFVFIVRNTSGMESSRLFWTSIISSCPNNIPSVEFPTFRMAVCVGQSHLRNCLVTSCVRLWLCSNLSWVRNFFVSSSYLYMCVCCEFKFDAIIEFGNWIFYHDQSEFVSYKWNKGL